jgi:DNA-binding MarR family transcriptional regulator
VGSKDNRTNIQDEKNKVIEVYHEDPVLRTFILFVQTERMVSKYIDSHLFRKLNISQIKFIVLMAFYFIPYKLSGAATAMQIARWTDTEPHNITTLITRMKEDGLLSTSRNDRDRRFVSITITNKGREFVHRNIPVAKDIVDQVMASVSRNDILQLEKILKVIRQNAYNGYKHLSKSH